MMAEDGAKAGQVDMELDMHNRDPNNLNPHIQTSFSSIIGEPDNAHSADCVWTNAYKCYTGGNQCCYVVLTYICALPLALCWGCAYACTTFWHIWNVTPCLRYFNMNFACCSRLFSTLVHCFCDPCYEAVALIFTKIYVHTVSNSDGYHSNGPDSVNLLSKPKGELYEMA